MPNLEHLFDMVADHFITNITDQFFYTSLDMRYAYAQVPLKKRPRAVTSQY